MMTNEQHFVGKFDIASEKIEGHLIFNNDNGIILLNLSKKLTDQEIMGRPYSHISEIKGELSSGHKIKLINNKCIMNNSRIMSSQDLSFVSDYAIWTIDEKNDLNFNALSCELKNAYKWSSLSSYEENKQGIVFKGTDSKEIVMFGARITFSLITHNPLITPPSDEETTTIQRLNISIKTEEKVEFRKLVDIRNKIISLISFATHNNISVEKENLIDFDCYVDNPNNYIPFGLFSLSSKYKDLETTQSYCFYLPQLYNTENLEETLVKLTPVIDLHTAYYKYPNMPLEMMFLNTVQSLETFHSRFYYDDDINIFKQSLEDKYKNNENYNWIVNRLFKDVPPNMDYIVLYSRLGDLFFGDFDPMFQQYFLEDYARVIADTRHYYTHYGKSKEAKALKGEELIKAISILRILLEYKVCQILNINIKEYTTIQLSWIKAKEELDKINDESNKDIENKS